MRFDIVSYERAGPVRFGMTREAVRNALARPWVSFKRIPADAIPNDHFEGLGVIANYKTPGIVNAMEFSAPAHPTYEEFSLLTETFESVKKFLVARDPQLLVNEDGLESQKLGIGVYAPNAIDHPSELPESIIVFERGYYD